MLKILSYQGWETINTHVDVINNDKTFSVILPAVEDDKNLLCLWYIIQSHSDICALVHIISIEHEHLDGPSYEVTKYIVFYY